MQMKERAREQLARKYRSRGLRCAGRVGEQPEMLLPCRPLLGCRTVLESHSHLPQLRGTLVDAALCNRCMSGPSPPHPPAAQHPSNTPTLCSDEEILHCLYSVSDNNSYLLFNRDPVDRWVLNGG